MPKLSLAKLERHLYAAADRLRQEGLDAATYKDYIFGMLFLKRCSDVWEAEHDALVARKIAQGISEAQAASEYGENPDYYDSFFVPDCARWPYLQSKLNDATEAYGSVLDKALGGLPSITRPWNTSWTTSSSCVCRAINVSSLMTPAKIWCASSAAIACATRTSSSQTSLGLRMNSLSTCLRSQRVKRAATSIHRAM